MKTRIALSLLFILCPVSLQAQMPAPEYEQSNPLGMAAGGLLVGALGVGTTYASESAVPLILTVPVQLLMTVNAECKTARANFLDSVEVGAWSPPGGGPGLALSTRF